MDVGSSDFPAEAMDRMTRNRGQAGSTRDSDHEANATEPNYEAALGQTSGGSGVAAGRTTSFQGERLFNSTKAPADSLQALVDLPRETCGKPCT